MRLKEKHENVKKIAEVRAARLACENSRVNVDDTRSDRLVVVAIVTAVHF